MCSLCWPETHMSLPHNPLSRDSPYAPTRQAKLGKRLPTSLVVVTSRRMNEHCRGLVIRERAPTMPPSAGPLRNRRTNSKARKRRRFGDSTRPIFRNRVLEIGSD
jgi:hypothetical protein